MRSAIRHVMPLVVLAACGRVDFDPLSSPDGALDASSADADLLDGAEGPDGAETRLTIRQREHAIGFTGTTVTLPQDVQPTSALVAIALAQEQPILNISDTLGQTWASGGEVVSAMTGSKVLAWYVCNSLGGADAITITPSSDNGPVHLAVVEIGNASAACFDQSGDNVVTTSAMTQFVTTAGPLASDGQFVVAGFGAWFDEVAYTTLDGDTISVSARPTPPAPMGDTLALVTSTRDAAVQTVMVVADHPTLYAAVVVSIR